MTKAATDFRVRGLVQGVGFRPTVYRIALEFGLSGTVWNDAEGVVVHLEGEPEVLERFPEALLAGKPPLARIDAVEPAAGELQGMEGFSISATPSGGRVTTAVTADACVCDACLDDIFNPNDRRWRYPFANCTHCGPRFTITRHLPYDRPQTAMAGFPMCPDCRAEYEDPLNRRFHAQPIACPVCGPKLTLVTPDGTAVEGDAIRETVKALGAGRIVAIKGLGGFHLACDAENPEAVATLRSRKQRDEKPLAVMVAGLASAERFAHVTDDEKVLLTGPAHPIVLLKRRTGENVPALAGVADGLEAIGVMLPYTPLHALIFHSFAGEPEGRGWMNDVLPVTLVMTSANMSGLPLCTENEEALERLSGVADLFLLSNRDIVTPCDDSVVRAGAEGTSFVRRSRGYAPEAVMLPESAGAAKKPVALAFGPYLKNTACFLRGREAFLTQHVGSLSNRPTVELLSRSVSHMSALFELSPEVVACDAHPDFPSTRLALEYADLHGIPCIPVHHHAAHVGVVAAERGVVKPLLGLALDGVGMGADRLPWGGELLLCGPASWARLSYLESMPMPGGDRAATEPWRMGVALMAMAGAGDFAEELFPGIASVSMLRKLLAGDPEKAAMLGTTTSFGRWFDGMSAILGLCTHQHDEATAAMRLEGAAVRGRDNPACGTLDVEAGDRMILADGTLSLVPLVRRVVDERLSGTSVECLAALVENAVIAALADWIAFHATQLVEEFGPGLLASDDNENMLVALTGGTMNNAALSKGLVEALTSRGLAGALPLHVPAGDGGLSLGEAWWARSALAAGATEYAPLDASSVLGRVQPQGES